MVRQLLKKEGFPPESLDLRALAQVGTLLDVQGIVLCSVLEFSRFRDSYRVSIRMVVPRTGETVWSAQGAVEGTRGQKSSTLLNEIVVSCLKELPALERQGK
jgi:Tfp pilus assembly protein PilN